MSAPRKIRETSSLDEMESEIAFTRSCLKADPDAQDLLPLTSGWLAKVDAVRIHERHVREAQADAEAARTIANTRLDGACEAFGDELLLAVKKNRQSPRWIAFFSNTVSIFVRKALPKQVARVQAWQSSKDPVFLNHKAEIDRWCKAADDALKQSASLTATRAEARLAKTNLARTLTAERDSLHESLAARARSLDLPREWANQFFKKEKREDEKTDVEAGQDGGEA